MMLRSPFGRINYSSNNNHNNYNKWHATLVAINCHEKGETENKRRHLEAVVRERVSIRFGR